LGAEELNSNYWSDPALQEKRGQEFHDKPVETIAMIEKMDSKGIARRDFLTIMGASMAMASVSCARRPVNKIIPYVVKPEEITPGVATWYASTCPETGEGLLVKTRESRPIKLEGNPDHPLNRGALSARTQASLLSLYDPERLAAPVKGKRGVTRASIKWEEADQEVAAALKAAGGKVRILSGAVHGESTRRLVEDFLVSVGASKDALVEFEVLGLEEISQGQEASFGAAVVPSWKFDEARLVVSLGADFLGVWPNAVEYSADWIKSRRLNSKKAASAEMSKLVCFESLMSLTGANADERHPVRAGDELYVALALAHEIIVRKKLGRFAADTTVSSALSPFSIESVGPRLGIEGGAEKLTRLADALWAARGKSIVVAGSVQSKTKDALALQVVSNLLNAALENEGTTVDGTARFSERAIAGFSALAKLIAEMNAGAVDVLVLHNVNPVYNLPAVAGFADAVTKVKAVVAVADRDDESAKFAKLVLPVHHYLENWGDASIRKGLISIQQPTIGHLHDTRAFEDILIQWLRATGVQGSGLLSSVLSASGENGTWHGFLKANWKETFYKVSGSTASFDDFWEGVLRDGVLKLGAFASGTKAAPRTFKTAALGILPKAMVKQSGITLALYSKISHYDGRMANNAWLQEMPDPVSTVTWDNYLVISKKLATELQVNTNDRVEVTVGNSKLDLPAWVQPGVHHSTVGIAVGFGRTAAGKVGDGVGANAFALASVENDRLVFAGQAVTLKKTGAIYRLAYTQWHNAVGNSENRPVINDITLAEFQKNPGVSNHTDPHLRMEEVPTMWSGHAYTGYRWGMSIDLSACTGCGACVIGCQAENNIPVVGRNNVRVSREMHWIRIDRYYSGTEENPNVVFQPMLCQHCENAPCETVCPVLATVHDEEGLNEQIYNRCVGTRYCQNNCPYKARRFNFFDHWKNYEGTANLVWNPDVSVRSRGIMEKCTFCIQRIRDGKDQANDKGVRVSDGDIKAACQQTCPTNAIVFGDINDPKSAVATSQKDARAFRALEVLNVKPVISYLTKVRNQEAQAGHAQENHGHA
jgi:molybdopterin-containing oxidoreductase family iron-sulfur binding subunit